VAHTSPVYLNSTYADPTLFTLNAELMYTADQQLAYVQIVDHGTSATNPDYYSTTEYYTVSETGSTVLNEVPRDIYYWDIVMPKITDDIPAYVDPAIAESNSSHVNNIVAPPTGRFWRDMLFNEADAGYPILADSLAGITVVWNRGTDTPDALHAITKWVNDTMEFTSGTERPHQPVRIYRKHIGRCGEHADITAAASRCALIPCTSILAMSHDHTWNEYWDGDWHQWEPVNNMYDSALGYEGWGWTFGSVFEIRSDGFLTPVTERYSAGVAHIMITVVDANNNPVDGARIVLGTLEGADVLSDMVGFTGFNGTYSFTVGEGREYCASVTSPVGNAPAEGMAEIVALSEDGGSYSYTFQLAGTMPAPEFTHVDAPADDTDDWRLVADCTAGNDIVSGVVTWDDIDITGTRPIFLYDTGMQGNFDLFVGTPDDYLWTQIPMGFYPVVEATHVNAATTSFEQPAGDWTMWIDNLSRSKNFQHVSGVIRMQHFGTAISDDTEPVPGSGLNLRIGPNPMRGSGTLAFSLPAAAHVALDIYDIRGRHVVTLQDGELPSGTRSMVWNGTDDRGHEVTNGVYLCRLSSAGRECYAKVLMLK
jgi:hypothetical protein